MVRTLLKKTFLLLVVSAALGLAIHHSFLWKTLKGDLIVQPLEETPQAKMAAARKISLEEARKRFDGKTATFVDARAPLYFQVGHIPGAISFPREAFEANPDLSPLLPHQGKRLVIYCNGIDCPDSGLLAAYLDRAGFRQLEIFEGGWPDWEQAGFPVEKNLP
jgi:rhodanese-related sulfurtransferase